MEIDQIRRLIRRGRFAVIDHAVTEGLKDGITVADMLQTICNGKIIERYPERDRCLISGSSASGLPIHVVIDFSARYMVDIITTYIPQGDQWIKSQLRKRRRKR
jgi:hypothetical protein